MAAIEKAHAIIDEALGRHYGATAPTLSIECLLLPSCGLMGDNRVYGYAWNIIGIPNQETVEARAFLKDVALRLTNEVVHDDGTRFVRVFAEVMY